MSNYQLVFTCPVMWLIWSDGCAKRCVKLYLVITFAKVSRYRFVHVMPQQSRDNKHLASLG